MQLQGRLFILIKSRIFSEHFCIIRATNPVLFQELHYSLTSYPRSPSEQEQLRQGIVPMETPFIMENVLDDGMGACVVM